MLILEYLIADSAQTTEIIGRLAAKDGHLNRSELRVMMVNMLKATERMVRKNKRSFGTEMILKCRER